MTALGPGVYSASEVPMERYVLDDLCEQPTLSSSVAKLLVSEGRTPAHARMAHPRLNPDYEHEHKDAFDLGSACHDWLLGDGATVEWIDANDWRTLAAKDAREAARSSGQVPMLEKHRAKVEAVCRQAKAQIKALPDAFGDDWVRAESELTAITEIDGVLCRGRPDRWFRHYGPVFHYKTTDLCAANWRGVYTRLQFDFTAAWYQRLCGGRQIFLVQEMRPPYLMKCYEPTEISMSLASRQVDYAITLWRQCLMLDVWPGYKPEIEPIEPYDSPSDAWAEREIVGETTPEAIDAYVEAWKP